MQVSKVNMITPNSFNGKNQGVDYIVDKAFGLLSKAKAKKSPFYLGTTKNGENVYIREKKLGKNADMYVAYCADNSPNFDIFHLFRTTGAQAAITKGETGQISESEAKRIGQVLDSLY